MVLAATAIPEPELALAVNWARSQGLIRPGEYAVLLRGRSTGDLLSRGVLVRQIEKPT